MSIKSSVARGLASSVSWGLKTLAHRNASQLPGRVALAIEPRMIEELSHKLTHGSVVVCGTNGKTTTNNVVANALEAAGNTVLCNRDGANMAPGVAAALLPGNSADWAVIEADELSTINILPELKPRYMLLLNLFRDQLDRAGEIDRVQDVIVSALAASPSTTLVACGDDPLVVGVARRAQAKGTKVIYFGIGQDLGLVPDRVPEARFCQVCGAELTYTSRTYAQLGDFSCPNCDFARPELAVVAHDIQVGQQGVAFKVDSNGTTSELHANFGGIYMVYNLMAAWTLASLCGVSHEVFQQTLDSYHPENGRLQHFEVAGRDVILNLAKNPTGFNQNISLLAQDPRDKVALICINDNYNDGKDVSWLWDVDFERLSAGDGSCVGVFVGGHRANDMQVRMKYAGIDASVVESVAEALGRMGNKSQSLPLYVLCNYSALWPAKAELEKIGERR